MLDRYDPRSTTAETAVIPGTEASAAAVSASETETSIHVTCSRGISTFLAGAIEKQARDRERVYTIDGDESRAGQRSARFGSRKSDLHDIRDDSRSSRRSLKHLEKEGLIRASPLSSDDRAVTLTDRGRDLLEANRYERQDRTHEPRQTFHAGIRKPREARRTTPRSIASTSAPGASPRPGRSGSARRPRLRAEARLSTIPPRAQPRQEGLLMAGRTVSPKRLHGGAREHELPYDDGHVRFPDARIEDRRPVWPLAA